MNSNEIRVIPSQLLFLKDLNFQRNIKIFNTSIIISFKINFFYWI